MRTRSWNILYNGVLLQYNIHSRWLLAELLLDPQGISCSIESVRSRQPARVEETLSCMRDVFKLKSISPGILLKPFLEKHVEVCSFRNYHSSWDRKDIARSNPYLPPSGPHLHLIRWKCDIRLSWLRAKADHVPSWHWSQVYSYVCRDSETSSLRFCSSHCTR
jgi:hypothetical protein